jgi:two-component system OmpR family sensor kinase
VSRLSIRIKLTIAFALAMVVVLAVTCFGIYLELADDLDESVDNSLRSRAGAVAASGEATSGAPGDAEEGFAQLLDSRGAVLDSAGGAGGRVLTRSQAGGVVAGARITIEREVPGIEGTARVFARPSDGGDASVVVVGQTRADRGARRRADRLRACRDRARAG